VGQLNSSSNLEHKSVDKLLNYNFNSNFNSDKPLTFNNFTNFQAKNRFFDATSANRISSNILSITPVTNKSVNFLDISKNSLNLNSTSDGKYYNNPLKVILSNNSFRKLSMSLPVDNDIDLSINLNLSEISTKFSNTEQSSKFKELKSGNMNFLSPDKNIRLVDKLHMNKGHLNFSSEISNLNDILNSITNQGSVVTESEVYKSSNAD
jgi:hypothetical protein